MANYPSLAEAQDAIAADSSEMVHAIADLPAYQRDPVQVAVLNTFNSPISAGALHAFAELAENYPGTRITANGSGISLIRDKTEDELREEVWARWQMNTYNAAQEAEKDAKVPNAQTVKG